MLLGLALLGLVAAARAAAEPLTVTAIPVPFDADDATRDRVGPLRWLGGLELSAAPFRFGGFSGLLVEPDGTALTAITDEGYWLRARLEYAADGWLTGLDAATFGPLHGPDGQHLTDKTRADAESLTALPDGSLAVAFERRDRIWIYPPADAPLAGRPRALPAPPGIEAADRNSGMEALATLADGALLAVLEGDETADRSATFLWRAGTWARLTYLHPVGFRPTGATSLPDGDLLILERSFNVLDGVAIRLARLDSGDLRPGAVLAAVEIARLHWPLTLDNMEGIAARYDAADRTLVYLISDDNFSAAQRSLLLLFELTAKQTRTPQLREPTAASRRTQGRGRLNCGGRIDAGFRIHPPRRACPGRPSGCPWNSRPAGRRSAERRAQPLQ